MSTRAIQCAGCPLGELGRGSPAVYVPEDACFLLPVVVRR